MPHTSSHSVFFELGRVISPVRSGTEAEAQDVDNERSGSNRRDGHEYFLPRVDGGKDAWLFLCGCFTIEALIWGEFDGH